MVICLSPCLRCFVHFHLFQALLSRKLRKVCLGLGFSPSCFKKFHSHPSLVKELKRAKSCPVSARLKRTIRAMRARANDAGASLGGAK